MSNSCKKETADCSMRQVCYSQSCYNLFTTTCCNSVHNSTVAVLLQQVCSRSVSNSAAAVLSQQFVAGLTTDCSSHVTTGRNQAATCRANASEMRPDDDIPQQADDRPAANCANLAVYTTHNLHSHSV